MLNNAIGTDGIQKLNNFASGSCFVGAFEVTRFRSTGGNLTKTFKSTTTGRVSFRNGDGSNPIDGFRIVNTAPGRNYCLFTLTYFNTRRNIVAQETIRAGMEPLLYAGNERLTNGRAVRSVEIEQKFVSPDEMVNIDDI